MSFPAHDPRRFQPRPSVKFGLFSMAGGRAYQEDRASAIPDVNYSGIGYFGVFDGHGGSFVSDYLSRNFHLQLSLHPQLKYDTSAALQETWQGYDDRIFTACQQRERDEELEFFPTDGSTATVALIKEDTLLVTNCGDSACFVVYADGQTRRLTEEHGVRNERERERCLEAGAEFLTSAEYEKKMGISDTDNSNNNNNKQLPFLTNPFEMSISRRQGSKRDMYNNNNNNNNSNNNNCSDNTLSPHWSTPSSSPEKKNSDENGLLLSLFKRYMCSCMSPQSVPTMQPAVAPVPPASVRSMRSARSVSTRSKSSRRTTASRAPKQRIYPGGLLVTRSFGDFYGKKEHLGGIKGGVVHDHGEVISIDMREEKIKYIILATDGVWDVISAEQAMAIIEGSAAPSIMSSPSRTEIRSLRAMSSVVPESPSSPRSGSPRSPRGRKGVTVQSNSMKSTRSVTTDARQEVHELVLQGLLNTKESAMDPSLTAAAKRLCAAAVNSRQWVKEGMRADNASCIIIEVSFPR